VPRGYLAGGADSHADTLARKEVQSAECQRLSACEPESGPALILTTADRSRACGDHERETDKKRDCALHRSASLAQQFHALVCGLVFGSPAWVCPPGAPIQGV
jgi:hypothetical protein